MQQVLFASSNKSKLEQFQFVADSYKSKVEIVSVYKQFPGVKPYDEEYETQYEIVEKGAHEIYAQVRRPIVVEDTILEVEALGGLPGLHASEYLKEKGLEGLLSELRTKSSRKARITSIVCHFDGKLFISSKNVILGHIATKPSYKEGEPTWVGPSYHPLGGGFNSIFILETTGRTLADHSAQEGLEYGYREPNFKIMLGLLT